MNLDLSGKKALICGGSRGLGLASAIELASLGAEITLLARTEELLIENVKTLKSISDLNHDYLIGDLSDLASLETTLGEYLKTADWQILLNNTGGPPGGNLIDANSTDLVIAFKRHIVASQELMQWILPGMKRVGYGRIINIVSTSVRQPIKSLAVSNTIRGAMASWSKTLSNELAETGITVNCILPGTTSTERIEEILNSRMKIYGYSYEEARDLMIQEIPMGRFAEPKEIGQVVAFVASPAASYMTGTVIPVDGGKIKSI